MIKSNISNTIAIITKLLLLLSLKILSYEVVTGLKNEKLNRLVEF